MDSITIKKDIKSIGSKLAVGFFITIISALAPLEVWAQAAQQEYFQQPTQNAQVQEGIDSLRATTRVANPNNDSTLEYTQLIAKYGDCAVSQIMANAASGFIKKQITNLVSRLPGKIAQTILSVPVAGPVEETLTTLELKDAGVAVFGIPILPSLDALGFCIVNSMIEYISESTITWINSGFEGNPIFIENFDEFFQNIADRQTAAFIEGISAPDFLCQPYKLNIQLGILNKRDGSYLGKVSQPASNGDPRIGNTGFAQYPTGGYGQCKFDQIVNSDFRNSEIGFNAGGDGFELGLENLGQQQASGAAGSGAVYSGGNSASAPVSLDSYVEGNVTTVQRGGWGAFYALTQVRENNIYGASNMALEEVARGIDRQQQVARDEQQLNPIRHTKDENGDITTPNTITAERTFDRLSLPENRLILAKEFDEVVDVLVDKLIKIAIDETLTQVRGVLN